MNRAVRIAGAWCCTALSLLIGWVLVWVGGCVDESGAVVRCADALKAMMASHGFSVLEEGKVRMSALCAAWRRRTGMNGMRVQSAAATPTTLGLTEALPDMHIAKTCSQVQCSHVQMGHGFNHFVLVGSVVYADADACIRVMCQAPCAF
jgi:hypothetical protein